MTEWDGILKEIDWSSTQKQVETCLLFDGRAILDMPALEKK
jgi:hypothetical protein